MSAFELATYKAIDALATTLLEMGASSESIARVDQRLGEMSRAHLAAKPTVADELAALADGAPA